MARFVMLETVTRRAPLGVRFIDLARGVPVTDSMVVTARPLGDATGAVTMAERSPLTGVHGFRTLPGLRAYETGERPASDWCAAAPDPGEPAPDELRDLGILRRVFDAGEVTPPANFVVSVEDRAGRFLAQTLSLCLPKERLLDVPLFSGPARVAPAGLGVVRGELEDRETARSAGWALVTVSPNATETYTGVADARGMFTVFMPYAGVLPALAGPPPHGAEPVDKLTWPLTVRVFYEPSRRRRIPGLDAPDTRSILEQGLAQVFDTALAGGPSVVRPIRLGVELVVTTQGRSRLLVTPP